MDEIFEIAKKIWNDPKIGNQTKIRNISENFIKHLIFICIGVIIN